MIISLDPHFKLPEPDTPASQLLDQWSSHLLHEKQYSYSWQGRGILSIKTVFNGQAIYRAGAGRFAVGEGDFLLLNHDQPYSVEIDSLSGVESFCLFFDRQFSEDVFRNVYSTFSVSKLLDSPQPEKILLPNFYERTYQDDSLILPAMNFLRKAVSDGLTDQYWLIEQFSEILRKLISFHYRISYESEELKALKSSTRDELNRRLHRARDYTSASFDQPLSLDEIARAACLSPNHLLRTFKQLFKQTTHQFLTSCRLEAAKALLTSTTLSITDISFRVGYESLNTFSLLFRQQTGFSSRDYRRQKKWYSIGLFQFKYLLLIRISEFTFQIKS